MTVGMTVRERLDGRWEARVFVAGQARTVGPVARLVTLAELIEVELAQVRAARPVVTVPDEPELAPVLPSRAALEASLPVQAWYHLPKLREVSTRSLWAYCLLVEAGEATVQVLAACMNIDESSARLHLRALLACGLVRAQGRPAKFIVV